jgi:dTDP-4-dehydrorhamnose 3,5-epimerase
MNIIQTAIPDVLIIEPKVFGDSRGFFMESWNKRRFDEAVGRNVEFVQDNHSRSAKGVLRGLHYQLVQPQGKLVRVPWGSVFDVAVDLRKSSPTFGKGVGTELSADNQRQMWIPEGFAHGFLVLSDSADFLYKTTDYYHPESEQTLRWNDPVLEINWPLDAIAKPPGLSDKDQLGCLLKDAKLDFSF